MAVVNLLTRGDLTLVDEFKITYQNDRFLVHDSGGDKNVSFFLKILNLNYLSQCSQRFADCTFRSAPAIFTQLYIVHGVKDNKSLPLVYLLAASKSKCCCMNFFFKY